MAEFAPSGVKTWHNSSYPSISPTQPSLSLVGKTVLLTGGGAGIGFAIAQSAAKAGASNLIILGRRAKVLTDAKTTIHGLVGDKTNVLTISTDLTKKEDVDGAYAEIEKALNGKKIDVLIPNAGHYTGIRPLGTETADEWQNAFDLNVRGLYFLITGFLPLAALNATVINISTAVVHLFPFPGYSSYAATKLAGTKLLEYFQDENKNIRVVNVHPGRVRETEMAQKAVTMSTVDHIDDAELAGDFVVWAVSGQAAFLKGRFVWVNWDVDELKAMAGDIEKQDLLKLGLSGIQKLA